MWNLIKAEMSYDRLRINIYILFCLASFVSIWFGVKWERNRVPMTMLMVLGLSLTAVYAGEKNRTIQKRDRLHVLLPISIWKIGISHLLYPIGVLLGIYVVYFLSALFVDPFSGRSLTLLSLSHMFTLTGLVLVVNAVILLQRDLRMTFTKKHQRFVIFLFWFVVYFGALLPFYVVTNFFGLFGEDTRAQNFLTRLLESPTEFIAAGLVLSAISLVVFVTRKSYVDS